MSTVYIAAEKFVHWNKDGAIEADDLFTDTIASHGNHHRFVVYFAPARFGLDLEDTKEAQDAWNHLVPYIISAGYKPNDVLIFKHEIDSSVFIQDRISHADENAVICSDCERDISLSQILHIHCLSTLPADISGMWPRVTFRRFVRAIFSAAFHI